MKTVRIARRLSVLLPAAALAFHGLAATTITPNGSELTYDVPDNETYPLNEAFPTTATTIIKTGGGTLEVNAPNTGRTGLIVDIRGGTVKSGLNERVFGTSDTVKVSPGASLWYTGHPANLYTYIFGTVEIAGDGPDHNGAFYYTGSGGSDIMITTLKVMAGAKVGGTGRFGARITNMGGNTLTNAFTSADNPYVFRYFDWMGSTQITNPGDIVQLSKKTVIQASTTTLFNGVDPTENTWTFATSSTLSLLTDNPVFPWAVRAVGSPTLQFSGTDATMNGPIIGAGSDTTTFEVTSDKAFGQTLTINADVTNLNFKVSKTNILVKVKNANFYCRVLNMAGGGALEVEGGSSHKISVGYGLTHLLNGARVRFNDAGTIWTPGLIDCSGENFATDGKVSTLGIFGQTVMALSRTTYPVPRIFVGSYWNESGVGTANGGWGTMEIRDGATVTNGIIVGTSHVGALYLSDANLYSYLSRMSIGTGTAGYGAVCASNANMIVKSGMTIGGGEGSVGHYVQLGGKGCHDASSCTLGGAYANFYLGNGASYDMRKTFPDPSGAAVFRFSSSSDAATTGESVFTCDNSSTCIVSRAYTAEKSNRTTQINLNNGGCFVGYQIWYSSDHSRAENTAYRMSFNGGVLDYQNTWETADILTDSPDRMVVHSGGVTVGVAANSALSSHGAFLRPRGKSIKSISLPVDADFLAATNIGPARIVFDGAGEGMTAFIAYDDKKGCLSDVVITSPGELCDETTRAYAVIPQYPARRFACEIELEEETGGDLVKTGAGSLTLDSTNTYAGATIVRGGLLTVGTHWAIPSNTTVRLEAGNLYMNYKQAYLKSIEGTGGSIGGISGNVLNVDHLSTVGMNGATFPDVAQLFVNGAWTIDGDELIANKTAGKVPNYAARVQFRDGSTIAFTGIEKLDPDLSPYPICAFEGGSRTGLPLMVGEALPGMWKFKVVNGVLSLTHGKGYVMVVR